jgi:hypothetical protein
MKIIERCLFYNANPGDCYKEMSIKTEGIPLIKADLGQGAIFRKDEGYSACIT